MCPCSRRTGRRASIVLVISASSAVIFKRISVKKNQIKMRTHVLVVVFLLLRSGASEPAHTYQKLQKSRIDIWGARKWHKSSEFMNFRKHFWISSERNSWKLQIINNGLNYQKKTDFLRPFCREEARLGDDDCSWMPFFSKKYCIRRAMSVGALITSFSNPASDLYATVRWLLSFFCGVIVKSDILL